MAAVTDLDVVLSTENARVARTRPEEGWKLKIHNVTVASSLDTYTLTGVAVKQVAWRGDTADDACDATLTSITDGADGPVSLITFTTAEGASVTGDCFIWS